MHILFPSNFQKIYRDPSNRLTMMPKFNTNLLPSLLTITNHKRNNSTAFLFLSGNLSDKTFPPMRERLPPIPLIVVAVEKGKWLFPLHFRVLLLL